VSKIQILELNQANIPLLVDIDQQAHLSPWSQKIFESSFNARSHNFYMLQDSEILGYYFAEFVVGDMTLENLCISPQHQGKGLAKKLMTHLIEYAKRLNTMSLFLEVRESNSKAIGLYESYGFEITGKRKEYYSVPNTTDRETALLMKKSFS
jgi:ribosomal-protein-alanine N-acetyltransferase